MWGTTFGVANITRPVDISIHIPHVGDDDVADVTTIVGVHFNPRPLCGGRRELRSLPRRVQEFQSTSPFGGRPSHEYKQSRLYAISIHVPCVGTTSPYQGRSYHLPYLNPRPPCGGRQRCRIHTAHRLSISIHVPRVGDDSNVGYYIVIMQISIHVPRVGDDHH